MTRRGLVIVATAAALSVAALTAAWPSDAPRIATGFVATRLCSATFTSRLDPDQVLAETVAAMPGVGLISWGLGVEIDRTRREVTTTLFGGEPSRAIYRDGLGCLIVHGDGPVDAALPAPETLPQPVLADIAGPAPVEPTDPRLKRALDQAFAEPDAPPYRRTKAVVVVKNGRIIAERYAPGYGVETSLQGWSMTKSVTNALIGILVRQGKLAVDQPAPVPLWQNPDDPRHAITIDHLLRHLSGLDLGSSLTATLGSTLAPVNRMKFVERDMAGFAEAAPLATAPGTAWNYQDSNTVILSRIIRDTAGGHAADVLRLARRELFGPLGMRDVTLEFDATGTAEGSSQMFAPPRAWARFGMLYLDDGVVSGRRILPEGWVRTSATATPGAFVGYGAGFWTNLGDSKGAQTRIDFGMPREAFHARGQFGQYTVIVPSEKLVVVRFGITPGAGDPDGVSRLVADVIAATRHGS